MTNSSLRLGPLKLALGGVGCLGLLVFGSMLYGASALFWGWIFMLIHGAVVGRGNPGYWTQSWGFWRSVAPWGLIAPFLLG